MKNENGGEMEIENTDTEIDSAIFQLNAIQNELDKLIERENEEIILVEQKYRKMKQQCYSKRSEIIETISNFWFNVFTSHPDICCLLTEDEEECLHYLTKFEIELAENLKNGYSMKFYFDENPYFKNSVLAKDFFIRQGMLMSNSTKIDWKKQLSLSSPKETLAKSSKKRNHHSPYPTFFSWFSNNDDPSYDTIAEVIKDDIWPNSLQYYLVSDPELEQPTKDEDSSDTSESIEYEGAGDKSRYASNMDPEAPGPSSSK